jgi:hypothetical protein
MKSLKPHVVLATAALFVLVCLGLYHLSKAEEPVRPAEIPFRSESKACLTPLYNDAELPLSDTFFYAEFQGHKHILTFTMRADVSCPLEPIVGVSRRCFSCQAVLDGKSHAALERDICVAFYRFAEDGLFWKFNDTGRARQLVSFAESELAAAFMTTARESIFCIRQSAYQPGNLPLEIDLSLPGLPGEPLERLRPIEPPRMTEL